MAFDCHCGTANITILPRVSFGYSSNRPGCSRISWINDHHHLTGVQVLLVSSPFLPGLKVGEIVAKEGCPELISQDLAVTPFTSAEEVTFTVDGLRKGSIRLPMSNTFGVTGSGSARSEETYPRGFEFKMPSTSTKTVCRTVSDVVWLPTAALRAILMDLISRSQLPPKCGANGGLNLKFTCE